MASIRKVGPDRFEVRVYAGLDPVTKNQRYRSRTVRAVSERAALRQMQQFIHEVTFGPAVGPTMTLGDLVQRWFAFRVGDWTANTVQSYRAAMAHLEPLADRQISKVSAYDLDALYGSIGKPPTVQKVHQLVRQSFRQAIRWGWVEKNPADFATPLRYRRREVQAVSRDDLRRIFEEADDEAFLALIYLAATTGARRGELAALRWRDVDLDEGRIEIRHNLAETGNERGLKETKGNRTRTVPIDQESVEILRSLRAWTVEKALASSGVTLSNDHYVWSSRPGNAVPLSPKALTRRFSRLVRRLGIENVTLHSLRHFTATQLIAAGVDYRTVCDRLGHGRPSITLGLYTHRTGEKDQEAADEIGGIVSGVYRAATPS